MIENSNLLKQIRTAERRSFFVPYTYGIMILEKYLFEQFDKLEFIEQFSVNGKVCTRLRI